MLNHMMLLVQPGSISTPDGVSAKPYMTTLAARRSVVPSEQSLPRVLRETAADRTGGVPGKDGGP